MTSSSGPESFWLSRPLVASGTVRSGCSGCFRTAGAVDAVLDQHNELHLLSVTGGKLEPAFKQPLFCTIKQMAVLPFGLAQPPNMQTQVLDHLLLLLDDGKLMVLKYSQVVQRFYIAAEAQLAAGTTPDPDYLGARMTVSAQPTVSGLTIAVSAKRGRIACLTASLNLDGAVQLSGPVLYAMPAPRVLGASYQYTKREMELGDIMDLVLLPAGNSQEGQQAGAEHLAVLSHRPDEVASHLVVFSWDCREQQLRKLGSVSVENRAGAAGFGIPLYLARVPKCRTAVLIIREWGLLLLECSALMQPPKPGQQVERCCMECTQQLAYRFQEQRQPYQQWARHHHLHIFAAKCVLPSLKQTFSAGRRMWKAAACDAEASTPTAPLPASEAEAAMLTHDAAAAVVAALQEAAEQDAAAAAADVTDLLPQPEAAVAAATDGFTAPAAADAAEQELYNTELARFNDGAQDVQQAAAAGVDADAAAGAGADDMIVDYDHPYYGDDPDQQYYDEDGGIEPEEHFLDAEGESSTAAEAGAASGSTGTSGSDSGAEGDEVSPPATEQQQEPSWTPGGSEDDGRTAAVVEPTSITAVAWTSSALGCSPAAAATEGPGLQSNHTSGSATEDPTNGPPTAAAAGAVADHLLVATSCGCLLQLHVSLSPRDSSMWTPQLFQGCAGGLPFRHNNCINILRTEKVHEVQVPTVSSNSSNGSRMGPVLLSLPQQRLLLVADDQSQVLLLQQRQQEEVPLQAGQGAEHADTPAAVAAAAAAARAGTDSPGDVTAHEIDQQQTGPCAAAAAAAAQAPAGTPAAPPEGEPGTPAADGVDIDTQPSTAAAAAADAPGIGGSRRGKKAQLGDVLAALKSQAAAGQPHGNSSPAAAASMDSPQRAQPAAIAAAAADGADAGASFERYVVTDHMQLLGKVGAMVAFPGMALHQQQRQQQPPVLVAARPGCEGGMRVLSHACNTTELLRGPAGMFEGVSGIWPIASSPDSSSSSNEDVALVFSFASGATRALSVGAQFQDVTEVLGLQGSQATLLAACVAEGIIAQVTQSGVRLCCLDALLSRNNDGGGRSWQGSPKSSRGGMGAWQQPLQQQQQQRRRHQQLQGAGSSTPEGHTVSGGARHAQQPSRLAVSSAAAAAAAAADAPMGEAAGWAAPAPAAAAAAAANDGVLDGHQQGSAGSNQPGVQQQLLLQGYSTCQAGSDSSSGSPSTTSAAQLQHDGHWHLQADRQQQQSAAIVLAAAAAGVVVVYSNTGKLVALSVICAQQPRQQQQQQRVLNLDPLDLNSDGVTPPLAAAAAAAAAAVDGSSRLAAGGNSGSSGSSGGTSKKRARSSWGLVELGSMQLEGQVSCLQVVAASAALPASPGSCSSSSSSGGSSSKGMYVIFVGRYGGSLQLLTLRAASGALQPLAAFDQAQLLPLQCLASVLRESGSEAGGGALSPADALQSAAAPVAVPESCVALPSWVAGGTGSSGAAGAGVRGAGRRAKPIAAAASPAAVAAGGSGGACVADESSSGCMQFLVSYRTGDVAAYRLDLLSLLQQQQQQQTAAGPVHVSADSALRVVSQLRLPSIAKLQVLPQQRQQHQQQQAQQQVLAVGGQVWLLELDRVTQRMTSCDVTMEPVLLASALSLPAAAGAGIGAGAAAGAAPPGSASSGQQQQQQQAADQHMVVATADGQLQLLRMHPQQQGRSVQVSTWLPHTNVSHLLQHPSTNLLLAACSGHTSPFNAEGLAGRDLGADESVWLEALDPCTGARLAAYLLSRSAGQYVTCLELWDTTWKPQRGAGKGGSSSGEQDTAAAAAAAGGAGDVVMRDAGAAAAGGGGGNEGRMVFRRAGRWWQRLRHRASLRGEGEDVPQQGEPGQQHQRSEARHRPHAAGRARHHAGPAAAAAAAAAADGSSSGSEHFFQLGSLLKGLDCPVSGGGAAKAHSSGRSNQGSIKTVKQRKGPLFLLGTEAYGDLDGCNGQVLVLQLMHSSRVSVSAHQQGPGVPASGSAAAAVVVGADAGWRSAAGQKGASDAGVHAGVVGRSCGSSSSGSSSSGGSWSIQRVARLRLPDAVSALAAFSEDLLLVATRQVLALFQLQQDRLVKAAYCFTRAPIASLSPAPARVVPAPAAGGTTGGSTAGLVFAADALMGVTIFQVNLHAATGQYSLQPIGMHCDVRQVSQVLCLPQALQPPAPAAVVRTVQLAEAVTVPLPATGQQQQEQLGNAVHRLQGQRQLPTAGGGAVTAAAAAAAVRHVSTSQLPPAGGGSLNQVQQMLEAGLRGLCLDEEGAVVEVGWARQRTVPAKWMRTLTCVPLGGRAAAGSLHAVGSSLAASCGRQPQQPQGARLTELLLGQPAEQDGLPWHWLPLTHCRTAPAVMAAAANGRVVCLQRLSAAEAQLLLALQQLLLRHPLTSSMVLGRQHLLTEEPSQRHLDQQPAAAASTPSCCSSNGQPAGLAPRQPGVVDARVLSVFLCLPYRMQQLLLDSSAWQPQAAQKQDGLRCRLQLLIEGCSC